MANYGSRLDSIDIAGFQLFTESDWRPEGIGTLNAIAPFGCAQLEEADKEEKRQEDV
jgi:hypothetical protein